MADGVLLVCDLLDDPVAPADQGLALVANQNATRRKAARTTTSNDDRNQSRKLLRSPQRT